MKLNINNTIIDLPKRVKKVRKIRKNDFIFDKPFHFYLGKDGFDIPENGIYEKNNKIYFYKHKSFPLNLNNPLIKNYSKRLNLEDRKQIYVIKRLTYIFENKKYIEISNTKNMKADIEDIYCIAVENYDLSVEIF